VTSTANQSVPQAELSENTVWRGTRYTVNGCKVSAKVVTKVAVEWWQLWGSSMSKSGAVVWAVVGATVRSTELQRKNMIEYKHLLIRQF